MVDVFLETYLRKPAMDVEYIKVVELAIVLYQLKQSSTKHLQTSTAQLSPLPTQTNVSHIPKDGLHQSNP